VDSVTDVSFKGEISTSGCLDGSAGPTSSTLTALRRVAVFNSAGGSCGITEEWRRRDDDGNDVVLPSNTLQISLTRYPSSHSWLPTQTTYILS